jgi:radical SAM superfamily enzyme YgiQ (UPF0313 family)
LKNFGGSVALIGEPERRVGKVARGLIDHLDLSQVPGIAFLEGDTVRFTSPAPFDNKLDELPLPLWEKWPLEGYWLARFAHPPVDRTSRFLPILTSRGCPYPCTFCIAPEVNPSWRGRSAKNVVDDLEYF